jgi:putative tryptophan/tyrosine transport system substrate-binding protein
VAGSATAWPSPRRDEPVDRLDTRARKRAGGSAALKEAPGPLAREARGPDGKHIGPRRLRCVTLAVLLLGAVLPAIGASAPQRPGPVRIGVLTLSWGLPPTAAGLRDGLRSLGYREDADFVLGVRFTRGDATALPAAARELVQHGVDLIFAAEGTPAQAARQATSRIPIVFAGVGDPLGLGLVESFARPGGNVTGVADRDIELAPKRLELFREIVPGLKQVLYLYDANDTYHVAMARVYREAARHLGLELVERGARTEREAQAALGRIRRGEVHGILPPSTASLNILGYILETVAQRGFPTMGENAWWVEQGGLAGYGPDLYDTGRQAARLVDKILKGAKPADVPVEVNSKIEFVISLKAAKALGLTVPSQVLYRADRVVE